MGVLDSFKATLQEHFDKKKADKEFVERAQLEAEVRARQIYEEDYKKHTLYMAKAQAHKDAAEKSGIAKLRATSRARTLDEGNLPPGSFFDKLRDYTQKNKAKTEANLKRTAEMREAGKKIQQERLGKNRLTSIPRKPFGNY